MSADKKLALITPDDQKILERLHKLRNKFAILSYIEEYGISWAEIAIDPDTKDNWEHDLYVNCYNDRLDN